MFKYWIQHTDLSMDKFDGVSEAKAIRAFQEFDWEKELEDFVPEEEGLNCVAPGIGFHNDDSSICLHICPRSKDSVFFHFYYLERTKALGLFNWVTKKYNFVANYPFHKVPDLIHWLYSGKYEEILHITQDASGHKR